MEFASVIKDRDDVNESHVLAKRGLSGAATSGLIIGIIAFLLGSWLIFSHLYSNKKWFRKKPAKSEEDLEMGNRPTNTTSRVHAAAHGMPAHVDYSGHSRNQVDATAVPVLTIQVPTPDASSASLSSTVPPRTRSSSLSAREALPEPEVLPVGEYGSAWSPLARPAAALPMDNLKLDASTPASRDSIVATDDITHSSTTSQSAGEATQEAVLSDTESNAATFTLTNATSSSNAPPQSDVKLATKPVRTSTRPRGSSVKPSPARSTRNTAASGTARAGPSFARPTRSSGFASPTTASASKDISKPTRASSRKPMPSSSTIIANGSVQAPRTARNASTSTSSSKPSGRVGDEA